MRKGDAPLSVLVSSVEKRVASGVQIGLWRAGQIKPHSFASLRLDDFAKALALLAERRAEGKIVLTMGAG